MGSPTGFLDAQYFGLAQRRKRVFVVGCLGDWRRAAAVLFERESLSGHPAPHREAWESVTSSLASRTSAGGGLGTDFDCDGGLIPQTVGALTDGAHMGGGITGRTRTRDGLSLPSVSLCLNAGGMGRLGAESETLIPIGGFFDVAHSLRADGFDASEDGTGRSTPLVATIAPTTSGGPPFSRTGNARVEVDALAWGAFNASQSDVLQYGDKTGPLDTKGHTMGVQAGMQVRRLTPLECERLQGFPDGYTLIPYRGKPAKDGPRYKALGNSMAVPCMAWIGRRIAAVNALRGRSRSALIDGEL